MREARPLFVCTRPQKLELLRLYATPAISPQQSAFNSLSLRLHLIKSNGQFDYFQSKSIKDHSSDTRLAAILPFGRSSTHRSLVTEFLAPLGPSYMPYIRPCGSPSVVLSYDCLLACNHCPRHLCKVAYVPMGRHSFLVLLTDIYSTS